MNCFLLFYLLDSGIPTYTAFPKPNINMNIVLRKISPTAKPELFPNALASLIPIIIVRTIEAT